MPRGGRVLACAAICGARARRAQGPATLKTHDEFGNGRQGRGLGAWHGD